MTVCLSYEVCLQEGFSTFVDLLSYRGLSQFLDTAFVFLEDGEKEGGTLSYGELDARARAIAAELQLRMMPGDRALLLYPPGLEFICAFFGCLYAGVVAVPAYPPKNNHHSSRLQAIVGDAEARVVLTTSSVSQGLELTGLHWLATDNINVQAGFSWWEPQLNSDSLAFLQYTSGSTGQPKGVMVSHGNLLHNQRLIQAAFGHTEQTTVVSWLPHYHDMGLVGNLLQPLYIGRPCIVMSPVAFLQKPWRWLMAISRYGATTSGGPNFAYDLCVQKITPEQRSLLDLSSWDVAFTGAEPIRAQTVQRFAETFADCGFRPEAFYPCYGMAETTLFISGGAKSVTPHLTAVDANALGENRIVTPANDSQMMNLVSCGYPWLEEKVVIVDPESCTQLSSERVGEIWVRSDSVAQGYWQQPEQTKKTFQAYLKDTGEGPFLRTGDLGFVRDGELFVTGRIKDVIIIRGHNYYPQDIELTVEQCHPALKPNGGAAFGVEVNGEERLVIVQEVERSYLRFLNADEVMTMIRQVVSEQHELQVYAVLLLKPMSLPKTSSGKTQRHVCRTGFLNGNLNIVADWTENPRSKAEFLHLDADIEILTQQIQLHCSSKKQQIHNWLVAKISQLLAIAPQDIDIYQPLSYYGIDSVQALSLLGDLEQYLGQQLSPSLVWDYPSIEKLIQHLSGESQPVQSQINLQAEAVLDSSIYPATKYLPTTKPTAIFLTGATGFLGAFLLRELLEKTQIDIYCLVRAANTDLGKIRLRKKLESYGLWQEEFHSRIIPVIGDLAKPLFGLSPKQFQNLAQQIDVIYHSGALLNYVYPYEQLKPINVLGTQEILRLATQVKTKLLHYISSIAVFESSAYKQQIVTEKDELTHSENIYLTYSQSKWVAERLVRIAGERGLPVNIYRPPLISGDSQTGTWNTDDIVCRMIKAGIQMKCLPDLDFILDIAPVDYVSRGIVNLSQQQTLGKTFHLNNPQPLHWQQLIKYIQSIGYEVEQISYQNWQQKINKEIVGDRHNPLYPLLPFLSKQWSEEKLTILEIYEQPRRPQINCQKTLDAFTNPSIKCPPVTLQLLNTYFSYFATSNFLQPPY